MLLNARHSAPSPHAHILQVLVSTHPLLCCGCCGKKWICHAHPTHSLPASLPQPTRNSELSCCCCCSRNAVEVCGHILARMFLYQTRLVATRRRDQTQRDQTRPDQTVVRVLGLLEQEVLASFTSCLLSFAALSLLAICFEFGINFSHRTQEIEMFP